MSRTAVSALTEVRLTAAPRLAAEDRVAFLGDSLTQDGWEKPRGWIRLLLAAHEAAGAPLEAVPAGVGGDRSVDMLARLDADVLSKKPAWMMISCGVNDVWWGAERGIGAEEFEAAVRDIIGRAGAAGARPVVLTATVVGEDLSSPENRQLDRYNLLLAKVSREQRVPLIDTGADFRRAIAAGPGTGSHLTTDGVHFNQRGEEVMAASVLHGLGLRLP